MKYYLEYKIYVYFIKKGKKTHEACTEGGRILKGLLKSINYQSDDKGFDNLIIIFYC